MPSEGEEGDDAGDDAAIQAWLQRNKEYEVMDDDDEATQTDDNNDDDGWSNDETQHKKRKLQKIKGCECKLIL